MVIADHQWRWRALPPVRSGVGMEKSSVPILPCNRRHLDTPGKLRGRCAMISYTCGVSAFSCPSLYTLPALVSFRTRLDLLTWQRKDPAKAARTITVTAIPADGLLDKKRVCGKPLLLAVLHVNFLMTFNHSTNPWCCRATIQDGCIYRPLDLV